jgi:hypothetical protein
VELIALEGLGTSSPQPWSERSRRSASSVLTVSCVRTRVA